MSANQCVICLDTILNNNNYCVSSCNHSFHLDCLLSIKNNKCPLCNVNLVDGDEETNNEQDNNEEDNYINFINNCTFDELIDNLQLMLEESELKKMLSELKALYGKCEDVNKIEIISDNYRKLSHDYDNKFNMNFEITSKLLKIKNMFFNYY
jgi:hypothetical protein